MTIQNAFVWLRGDTMTRGIKVGITGLPGAGKTQALVKVIEMLEEESLVGGGMATGPIIESGKREVDAENSVKAVKDAMEVDKPIILTLHKKSRNPLLQDIRRRDDVRILEVTPIKRHLLPYTIIKLIKGEYV